MTFSLHALALAAPGFFRLGRLRLPVYGVFAAVGLIAALALSQRAARRVGLDPDKVWDAGMFAAVAAFVASRFLLVAFDFRSFLRFPVLVLSLPSLTYAGMLLTGFATCYYLRAKGLPWRSVLDAWAPCAAVLAAVLSLGHLVEGTDAGMPTSLPWGMRTAGDSVLGRVHPVQLYEVVLALALGAALWRLLVRRRFAGEVAAAALMWGGLGAFALDFVRQPVDTFGAAWLDPGQVVALGSLAAGFVLSLWSSARVAAAPSMSQKLDVGYPDVEADRNPG